MNAKEITHPDVKCRFMTEKLEEVLEEEREELMKSETILGRLLVALQAEGVLTEQHSNRCASVFSFP